MNVKESKKEYLGGFGKSKVRNYTNIKKKISKYMFISLYSYLSIL